MADDGYYITDGSWRYYLPARGTELLPFSAGTRPGSRDGGGEERERERERERVSPTRRGRISQASCPLKIQIFTTTVPTPPLPL